MSSPAADQQRSPAPRVWPVVAQDADRERQGLARAYTGDAHHYAWPVCRDRPPEYVDLPVATGSRRYRLVHHPRTGAVALDPTGALVFVPAPEPSV